MQFKETRKDQLSSIEGKIMELSRRLEDLVMQFNLYFSGEIRVPPEQERESLAASIRNLQSSSPGNAAGSLLMQNLNSRFALYNNMWLKKMHDLEVGLPLRPQSKATPASAKPQPPPGKGIVFDLSNPDTFQDIYRKYSELMTQNNQKVISDKALSTALANRMKDAHVDKASVSLSFENGKLKIRLRK